MTEEQEYWFKAGVVLSAAYLVNSYSAENKTIRELLSVTVGINTVEDLEGFDECDIETLGPVLNGDDWVD